MCCRQMASLSLYFHMILISASMPKLVPFMACLNFFFLRFFLVVKIFIVFSVPELSSENLRTCFQIVNAYLYLSATDFLQVRHSNY